MFYNLQKHTLFEMHLLYSYGFKFLFYHFQKM